MAKWLMLDMLGYYCECDSFHCDARLEITDEEFKAHHNEGALVSNNCQSHQYEKRTPIAVYPTYRIYTPSGK